MRAPGRIARAALVLALVSVACSSGDDAAAPDQTPTVTSPEPSPSSPAPAPSSPAPASPSPGPASPSPKPTVPDLRLRRVGAVTGPVGMAVRADDPAIYVIEQRGRIVRIKDGRTATVLDIRDRVGDQGNEQGLLGLAFSPDGSKLYVNYTDNAGDTRIVEYGFTARRKAEDPRELLRIDQPFANHNGGMLAFGPDGYLYASLGDGGSGGDPRNNAQSLDTLLGKILRIDPRPGDGRAYRIPRNNPFVGRSGRGEIWAYGLRNPWRFSFDAKRGDLWIGDVGQGSWEEIDFQSASSNGGENYGWDRLEGRHRFEGSPPPDHVLPIYEYPLRGGNCAVTGGYVYRGARMPGLNGWYLFADHCAGQVLRLRRTAKGNVSNAIDTGLRASQITSFGQDADGEVYVISRDGPIYRIEPR